MSLLDKELAERDGEDHDFYHQFNSIDSLNHIALAFENEVAISCGAFKIIDAEKVEIKRMYSLKNHRGKGYASIILLELEKWARELGYPKMVLETGLKQPEAIALYKKNGFLEIDNYGPYIGVENSKCFEKNLKY